MEILALLRPVILLSVLAVAAVTDVIKHRVGNRLLLAGALLETAVHIAAPVNADPDILGCYAVFLAVLFVLFVMRLLGGADVKMYALCMLAYPDDTGMRLIGISLVLAALWSAYLLVSRGILTERLTYFCRYLRLIGQGNPTACTVYGKADNGEVTEAPILPMAVFIFIGACITVVPQV